MLKRLKSLILVLAIAGIVGANVANADLVVLGKGNAPIYVSDKSTNHFDFNNDGLIDYYVKAHYTGNSKQTLKVDYKIQDECVDGDTFESAKMKLGFTSRDFFFFERTWFTNLVAWNPWFKAASNDENKRIDLVSLPKGALPIDFPSSGDDLIVGADKKGSFIHAGTIKELDGQPGWEGSIFFSGPTGEYFMWTIHPAEGTEGCDTLAAFGIPIIIEP